MAHRRSCSTAQRILEVALELFNRFGEPNVSTALISAELGISPGNLYYHYPAKEALVVALFERFEQALEELHRGAARVRSVEDAWRFFHAELGLIWSYRFLYRDLNAIVARNRRLETGFPQLLLCKQHAVQTVVDMLRRHAGLALPHDESADLATALVLVLSYWLSYEYVQAPRQALEPHNASHALQRGTRQVAHLLLPHLDASRRRALLALSQTATPPCPTREASAGTALAATGH